MKNSTLNKLSVAITFLFLVFSNFTFSQTTGDFRSNAAGDWQTLSTWQSYNGTSWIAATSYPGQNNGTYKVTVDAAHTVVINTTYVSANMGDVEVLGVLNLVAGSNPKTVTLNTPLLDIGNGGELRFDTQKVDLYLPTNAVLAIQIGGNITGACSNNTEIFIGTRLIAVCNGGGGGVLTFGEIVAGGGTLNANIDNPSDNAVFCQNSSVNMQGSYSGTTTEAITYSGFISDPGGTTTSYVNLTSIPSYTFTQVGTYILSFTVTTTVSGSPYSNTETHTITVDPESVGGSVTGGTTICSGSPSGLLTLSGQTGSVVRWEKSVSPFSAWTTIANTTSTYTSGTLTQTTQFRAVVQSGVCPTANSLATTVTVDPTSVGGTAASNQSICTGSSPANITLTGNTGTIQWQVSTNNATFTDISGATGSTLTSAQMGPLTSTRYYRALVTSGTCASTTSNTVTVTVSSPSVGGLASINQSICSGTQPANLTLTGQSGTIQWQVSSDNVTYGNIGGATASTLTSGQMGTLTATRYYRARITNGGCTSANSSVVTITVNPTPAITGTTPGSRSGTGTVTLGATTSFGTISWFAANTGGVPLATGTSYTTPSIATTTTYFVSSSDGTCTSSPRTAVIATVNQPEIDVIGNSISIVDGDSTPTVTDFTDFSSIDNGTSITRTFTIHNTASAGTLTVGAITIAGADASLFTVTTAPPPSIAPNANANFVITFSPTSIGVKNATISFSNNDSNENPYNFSIRGTSLTPLAYGPGGVTASLKLWLKANAGHTLSDGQNLSTWASQGRGSNAMIDAAGREPTYWDNSSRNVNFNSVIEFDNNPSGPGKDATFTAAGQQYLTGSDAFYTQEIFLVVIPDLQVTSSILPMDLFCGNDPLHEPTSEDVTGLGFGRYTAALTGELITYGQNVNAQYRIADNTSGRTYDNIGIINARNNPAADGMELFYNARDINTVIANPATFYNISDTNYWIGRSEIWGAGTNARYVEIINYRTRKTDANLTDDRNKIQSYLAIKYGITLGTNGTSQDYVDSAGNVIWDVSANNGYNYDIAGIGRDDNSQLNQKQSKSVNETSDGTGLLTGFLTIGLTDISTTNSANTNTFGTDKEYLVWGNDGADLNLAATEVSVNMSKGITPALSTDVSFVAMQRIWKIVETGGDIPSCKVRIPQNCIRNINPPGSYLMFISSTGIFDPTADYRVMTSDGNGNLEADYDFDGTKYITFGYAPQVVVERSVYFDGIQDYIDVGDHKDLNSAFTVSSWIKRTSSATDVSILSKRDATFTEGYDFKIRSAGRVEMVWNGGTEQIIGTTAIPVDEWHHVAVIYSGGTANLYIDGVLDQTETGLSNPTATTQSFIIAAAGKTSTTALFEGNIDEVRIWDVALSEKQLHYIMNQEIEANATFVDGMELPTTITKNEFASIPWSNLAGYYPMSIYTYTNTNDHSDNQNQGALRNLDTVDRQTAPLPYESDAATNWDTASTWINGSQNIIPGSASIVDPDVTVDWNIVKTTHNITMSNASLPAVNAGNRTLLGLTAGSTSDLIVSSDYGLTVTHYLELNGSIDLEGESQLIQTDDSVLVVGGSGDLERDQQGTADTYTYNYWSSPVGFVTTTSTNDTYASRYTVSNILSDGSNPAIPAGITFLTSGYNGSSSPFGIADYWIWKFADLEDGNYSLWQHMRSTGNILPGEGFTMKGPGTGTISTPQNYVFNGIPNNGDITLTINAGNDYLVGNPYPSALNAHEFLNDNTHTNGTLYFWEHWGGGTHNLSDYRGGYALYNFSGGTASPSKATSDADVDQTGSGTKLPGQYIPVSQGFFVYGESSGTVKFENDQRLFVKEVATSTFIRMNSESSSLPVDYNEDGRKKIRIGFDSFNNLHRQLLLTVDPNASSNVDWGYDGKLNGNQIDDMYWMIDNDKYVIQGVNIINPETEVPLGIHVRDNGMNYITIDHLENIPNDVEIYAHDSELNVYHDLRLSDYEVYLTTGSYLNRFAIVFTIPNSTLLSNDEFEANSTLDVFYSSDDKNLDIHNPNLIKIESLELFNVLGQSIYYSNEIEVQHNTRINVSHISTGAYIINLKTPSGKISKKVLVE